MAGKPSRVLIIGGGMYVAGRGTDGAGTVGPAILETVRAGLVEEIGIVTTSKASAEETAGKLRDLSGQMGVTVEISSFGEEQSEPQAYLKVLESWQPDAAVVVVPDDQHAEVSQNLSERGIHQLMVKPMAPSLAEARAMAEAAQKANIVAQVEFHKRLDEANLHLLGLAKQQELGLPLYAVIQYSQQKQIPEKIFRKWSEQTNIFQYLGVHYVDLLHFIFGFTPVAVSCTGQKDYLASKGIDTWDATQTSIEWRRPDGGQFVSMHTTNWIDPDCSSAMSDQKISVVGTQGRFDSDQKDRGVMSICDGGGVQQINPYFSKSYFDPSSELLKFDGYGIRSVTRFFQDIMDVKNGLKTPSDFEGSRPTFSDCMVSVAVTEAAGASLNLNGKRLEIDL